MLKRHLLILSAFVFFAGNSFAQKAPCYSDEIYRHAVALHPEILKIQADLDKQIKDGLKRIDYNKYARTTDESGNDTFWYDIPIVIHVVHDFGPENLSDNALYNDVVDWNKVYAKENSDTLLVIQTFKKYIGNIRIRLHLATVDPLGNPTKGIVRHRSYLSRTADDQAKFDVWDNAAYVNIWVVNNITSLGGEAAAYGYFPYLAAAQPYYDGVICDYEYVANDYSSSDGYGISKTMNHELGHVFSLYHPWNNNTTGGQVCTSCGDDDVDDTPPTMGHGAGASCTSAGCTKFNLYDTTCASHYDKSYPRTVYVDSLGADSDAHYPDTVNAQNIMDYTYCDRMFTIGQSVRMHAALNSDIGHRDSLWAPDNLLRTGVVNASGNFISLQSYNSFILPDLPAIPDFNVKSDPVGKPVSAMQYFTAPGIPLIFYDESWNDTIESTNWTFSNSANLSSNTLKTAGGSFTNSFNQPGWVTLTLTANGNNTTPGTLTNTQAVFVTNASGTKGDSYYQEFNSDGDVAMWPMFNYYNNEFHWQLANVGYYDNTCMMYTGYDSRYIYPYPGYTPTTGNPQGDIDDFFSVPMDLSSATFKDTCNLNFMYSGASRTSNIMDMNDMMQIEYSTDSSRTWKSLSSLSATTLANMGTDALAFVPSSMSDWSPMTVGIPKAGRTSYTIFRFRYLPGSGGASGSFSDLSTGNNFYLDRINFSTSPASISTVKVNANDIAVVPNPTHGNAYIVIKDASTATAQIRVTDVAGKIVYTIQQQLSGNETRIEIPQSAISVQGMYMVHVVTGNQVHTQKLVVY